MGKYEMMIAGTLLMGCGMNIVIIGALMVAAIFGVKIKVF